MLFPRVSKTDPIIHTRSTQTVSVTWTADQSKCGLGEFTDVEDFWWGTVCEAPNYTPCQKGLAHSKGGYNPQSENGWNLMFNRNE
jgi:hypothetical protein